MSGEVLRELGLEPWVMTTGSRGYHVIVPLRRHADFDTFRALARGVATLAAARERRLFTTEQRKAGRQRRLVIDAMRNTYGHTAVAPYAVRARDGAPIATPLHGDELSDTGTRPDRWTLATVPNRLHAVGDPWKQIGKHARPSRRRVGWSKRHSQRPALTLREDRYRRPAT